MPIVFEEGWNTVDANGLEGLNTVGTVDELFSTSRLALIKADNSNGALANAIQNGETVTIVKGFHQDTQVSSNPKDEDRSSNLHLTIRLPGEVASRHAYVVQVGTGGYRLNQIT